MRKIYPNKLLMFSIITAFLFLQWSATHIHLASNHEHDGDKHQHAVTAHKHQLASHHTDTIDESADMLSHADNNKVVQLDHVCSQHHGKLAKHFAITSTSHDISGNHGFSKNTLIPFLQDRYQPYHQYSFVRLRAPPATS